MATITTDTYLDDSARTAGETWSIGSGAKLTVRTDTRWHANSPASMTGSFGNQTITDGEILYDGRNVRWLTYDNGSGNVPAIGTSVTQAGVSASYLLAVYADLVTAPVAVGAAMPATGYMKFREVTGAFATGALTGIGADAVGADVVGWLEIVGDEGSKVTVPRLGKHTIRGDWFYLDNTDGTVGQTFQIPTNGGGSGTLGHGLWIENSTPISATYTWAEDIVTVTLSDHKYLVDQEIEIVFSTGGGTPNGVYSVVSVIDTSTFTFALTGSGTSGNCTVTSYEFWPTLDASGPCWSRDNVGAAYTETDRRQNFVKDNTGGQLQIGEAYDLTATYANIAPTSGTYETLKLDWSYTWAADVVTISSTSVHKLHDGQSVHLDFTSGGATAYDGTYTITVVDIYTFTAALAGSGASGNVTVRIGYIIWVTYGQGIGDVVNCNFTSGAGVDGDYTIYAVPYINHFYIEYPHSTTTSGNVDVRSRLRITYNAHALAVGNRVYLDFTSGGATDGIYTIIEVAANTFDIAYLHNADISGDVTIKQTLGNIPASGCRVRVPNIFLRNCPTATRANNSTSATWYVNTYFDVSNSGYIDFEFAYSNWYYYFNGAYYVRLIHGCSISMVEFHFIKYRVETDDYNSFRMTFRTTSYANMKNGKFIRNISSYGGWSGASIGDSQGLSFSNITVGSARYARGSDWAYYLFNVTNSSFINCRAINEKLYLNYSTNISIRNHDHVDRIIGYTNATTTLSAVEMASGCNTVTVDNVTFGYNGEIINTHCGGKLIFIGSSNNIIVKNVGTTAVPLKCGLTFRPNLYMTNGLYFEGGSNDNIKFKRIYLDGTLTSFLYISGNTSRNTMYESVRINMYQYGDMEPPYIYLGGLDLTVKGFIGRTLPWGMATYGTHYMDTYLGDTVGQLILSMCEPSTTTSSQFTMVSGTAKFNGGGAILLNTVGDQAIWEDNVFRLGYTGFANVDPTLVDATAVKYTVEYQIDTGSGYSGTWQTANGTNLSAETIDPAVGFKFKTRVTTGTANTEAMTYIKYKLTSTLTARNNNLYPLQTVTVKVTAEDASDFSVIENARVYLTAASDGDLAVGTVIMNTLTNASGIAQDINFEYTNDQPIVGRVRKGTSAPFYKTSTITGTITSTGLDIISLMVIDS